MPSSRIPSRSINARSRLTRAQSGALTTAIVAGVLLALPLTAAAQQQGSSQGPTSRPDKQTAQDSDKAADQSAKKGLLAGPTVKEADSETGGPASMTRDRRAQQMPLQTWLRQLRSLGLDRGQSRAIQPLIEEHQKAQRAFQQEHGRALSELRGKIRQARQTDSDIRELRQEVEKIQQQAPKPQDLQEAIWEQLTEKQQEQMQEQIDEWRKQRAAAQRERQQRQSDRATDAMTDADTGSDQMMDQQQGSDRADDRADSRRGEAGETDRPIRDRIRDRLNQDRAADTDLSDLDANARKRLRFLRALQQRRRDR